MNIKEKNKKKSSKFDNLTSALPFFSSDTYKELQTTFTDVDE